MKILSSILIILLFFAACANRDSKKKEIDTKENLIQKASNKNIDAMIDLAKYYKFPQTKEGLYYFNMWYPLVEKSKDIQKQIELAKIYYKYNDMFVNGEKRVLKLLNKTSDLGDITSSLFLIKIYLEENQRRDIQKDVNNLIDKIKDKLSNKQLINLYNDLIKKHEKKISKKVLNIIKEKGYEEPFSEKMRDLLWLLSIEKDKKKVDDFIDKVIASKNEKNIFIVANFFEKTNIYGYENNLIRLYKGIIKNNQQNAKAYFNIYKVYTYSQDKDKLQINKNTALKYLEKASDLDYPKAIQNLLEEYTISKKTLNKYNKLEKKLLQSNKGKIALAKYYTSIGKREKALNLLNEAANNGNKDAIIKICMKVSLFKPNPKEYELSRKWQDFVLKSKDEELKIRLIKEINDSYYPEHFQYFLKKMEEKKSENKITNILQLRDLSFKSEVKKDYKTAIKYSSLASLYGDVYSKIRLAKLYLNSKINQYDKAVNILTPLVEKEDWNASKELIHLYMYPPTGHKKQALKAIEIYKKYADKGDIYSTEKLAAFYICDTCKEKKKSYDKKAFYYIQQLVKLRGNDQDYATLAWSYNFSKGVKEDLEKAKKYYLIAAKKGYYHVYYNLAWLYYNENKTIPMIKLDYKEARKYLELGYKHRDKNCTKLLAWFYQKGYGVEKNIKKANQLYEKAKYLY